MSSDELNNISYFAILPLKVWFTMVVGQETIQDPSTYLDTLNTKNGGSLQNFGLEPGQREC